MQLYDYGYIIMLRADLNFKEIEKVNNGAREQVQMNNIIYSYLYSMCFGLTLKFLICSRLNTSS